jgi:hypothetical protein
MSSRSWSAQGFVITSVFLVYLERPTSIPDIRIFLPGTSVKNRTSSRDRRALGTRIDESASAPCLRTRTFTRTVPCHHYQYLYIGIGVAATVPPQRTTLKLAQARAPSDLQFCHHRWVGIAAPPKGTRDQLP